MKFGFGPSAPKISRRIRGGARVIPDAWAWRTEMVGVEVVEDAGMSCPLCAAPYPGRIEPLAAVAGGRAQFDQ